MMCSGLQQAKNFWWCMDVSILFFQTWVSGYIDIVCCLIVHSLTMQQLCLLVQPYMMIDVESFTISKVDHTTLFAGTHMGDVSCNGLQLCECISLKLE